MKVQRQTEERINGSLEQHKTIENMFFEWLCMMHLFLLMSKDIYPFKVNNKHVATSNNQCQGMLR